MGKDKNKVTITLLHVFFVSVTGILSVSAVVVFPLLRIGERGGGKSNGMDM